MKVTGALDVVISQADFADLIGVSEARVSQLVSEGVITRGETGREWLLAYCERLRDMAAGRMGAEGGLDLVQERAALARSQRVAQELKNAVARSEYAPIGLLSDVLGAASSAVVDRFEQLDAALRKECPDLQETARMAIHKVITSARNEWIRSTASLVEAQLVELDAEADDEQDGGLAVELDD